MGTITVRGLASLPVAPDEAGVVLTLSALADTPDASFREIAQRATQLEQSLDEIGIDPRHRSTAGIRVHAEYKQLDERRELRGYRAQARSVVRLRDVDLVARVIAEAVRAGAQLEGPIWSVDEENPAHLEASRRAGRAARRKAEAYAEALGLRLGSVQQAVEAGSPPHLRAFAPIDAEVPVQSGEQSVTAAVEVTFELEPGA